MLLFSGFVYFAWGGGGGGRKDVRDHIDKAHADDEDREVVIVPEAAKGAQREADDVDKTAEDEDAGYSEVLVVASPRGKVSVYRTELYGG